LGAELPFLWQLSYGNEVGLLSVGAFYLDEAAAFLQLATRKKHPLWQKKTTEPSFFLSTTKCSAVFSGASETTLT
jgi:hypothetical protein